MSELKPCPFCGNTRPQREEVFDNFDESHYCSEVRCPGCFVEVEGNVHKEADVKWNTRASGWISVKDRLPESPREVLVWIPNAGMYIGYFNSRPEYQYWMKGLGEYIPDPSHWRPLPELPEEE